jgi:hypothetical protein
MVSVGEVVALDAATGARRIGLDAQIAQRLGARSPDASPARATCTTSSSAAASERRPRPARRHSRTRRPAGAATIPLPKPAPGSYLVTVTTTDAAERADGAGGQAGEEAVPAPLVMPLGRG